MCLMKCDIGFVADFKYDFMLENRMHLCCQVAGQCGALAGCVLLIPPSC